MTMGVLLALAAQAAASASGNACQIEGAAFMRDYAADLSAGDRAAIARRYSARGAFFNGFEPSTLRTPQQIEALYARSAWQRPEAFAWIDLRFEAVSEDACLVAGGFSMTRGGRQRDFAYSGLLRRENGAWRIRLEHENALPPPRAE